MKKNILKKLHASTLIEVLVAMVIMSAVFASAAGIYIRVSTSGISARQLKAAAQVQTMLLADVSGDEPEETKLTEGELIYVKTVRSYQSLQDLRMINVDAYQNGKLLYQGHRIIKLTGHAY